MQRNVRITVLKAAVERDLGERVRLLDYTH